MATLFKQKGSPYWWLSWMTGSKRFKVSTKVPHHGAKKPPQNGLATEILRKKQEEIARLAFGLETPVNKDTPIKKWAEEYLGWYQSTGDRSPKTIQMVIYLVQDFTQWAESKQITKMVQVSQDLALQYFKSKSITPKTWKNICGVLAHMWEEAKDRKLAMFEKNPWRSVIPSRIEMKSRRPLTDEEVSILLKKAKGWMAYLVHMGAYTGERFSALVGLPKASVNFEKKVIHFPAALLKQKKDRFVFIPPPLEKFLKAYKSPHKTWLDPKLIELNENSTMLHRNITAFFRQLEEEHEGLFKGATFHCLRHTFASKLANAGVPEAIRKEIVGHSTSVSHALYVHESEQKALALAEYLKGVSY